MGIRNDGSPAGQESVKPSLGEGLAAADQIQRLSLPEEVTTQEAATILGCSKHTISQYLENGLLERRNVAPPSSHRPIYRLTLRSVLELRLGYQRSGVSPPQPVNPTKARRRPTPRSDYQPKHLRRKKAGARDGDPSPES